MSLLPRRLLLALSAAASVALVAGCTSGTESGSGSSHDEGGSAAATATSLTTSSAAPVVSPAEAELTPVVGTVTTEPAPVMGSDGNVYLAYELSIVNAAGAPVVIKGVRVRDADTGEVVQERSGAALLSTFKATGAGAATTAPTEATLNGGQHGFIWLSPSFDPTQAVPHALVHELELSYANPPNALIAPSSTETIAPTPVRSKPAPAIAPPLQGDNWFDGNGCCDEVTPHRGAANPVDGQFYFAERFGVDWVQLDAQGRLLVGDPTSLSSYPYYGAPITAVADGEIVAVHDGEVTQTPGSSPAVGSLQVTQYGGNYVVQRFTQGGEIYYAFYAHLEPGSMDALQVGQQVATGGAIGKLGNTGNTDSPHLHFHVMDGPDPLASNGLPYRFSSFQLVGRATGDDALLPLFTGGALTLAPGAASGPRTDDLPLYLDLVDFPAPTG